MKICTFLELYIIQLKNYIQASNEVFQNVQNQSKHNLIFYPMYKSDIIHFSLITHNLCEIITLLNCQDQEVCPINNRIFRGALGTIIRKTVQFWFLCVRESAFLLKNVMCF